MKMLGRYEEALDNYTVAVQTYLEAVGEKHISYTYALANLGVAYKEAGEKKKGLEKLDMLDRAYEVSSLISALLFPSSFNEVFTGFNRCVQNKGGYW